MKFLITNDDGIDAPGIATLVAVMGQIGEVVVVAPDRAYSGCGHQVTTDRPIACHLVQENWYRIDGSPADCVRLGLHELCSDVDWVISGINDGGNMGIDIFMSGTVAAAREAAFWRRPAIAISQYRSPVGVDWERTAVKASKAIQHCLADVLPSGSLWNVNLPADEQMLAEMPIVQCPADGNPLPTRFEQVDGKYEYRGLYRDRIRDEGTDVAVCFSGAISISRL